MTAFRERGAAAQMDDRPLRSYYTGANPALAVDIDDLRARAHRLTPRFVLEYLEGGAGQETTLARERAVYGEWLFMPRTLMDEAREVALGATRESVWADRLRFDTIRWMTARQAPRKYVERLVVAQVSAEIAEESSDRIKTIKIIRFERSPDGEEVLAIPPRNAEEEARWERAYGRPYDGPR